MNAREQAIRDHVAVLDYGDVSELLAVIDSLRLELACVTAERDVYRDRAGGTTQLLPFTPPHPA